MTADDPSFLGGRSLERLQHPQRHRTREVLPERLQHCGTCGLSGAEHLVSRQAPLHMPAACTLDRERRSGPGRIARGDAASRCNACRAARMP